MKANFLKILLILLLSLCLSACAGMDLRWMGAVQPPPAIKEQNTPEKVVAVNKDKDKSNQDLLKSITSRIGVVLDLHY